MIDFDLFRSATFLGANLVGFIVSFAMLAIFFFIALYMQNFLDYSPLEAGVRFLPATLIIIVTAPIAGRLADRFGPRPLIVAGMVVRRRSRSSSRRTSRSTPATALLLPAFMLMGLGHGLSMSPMSTAAMNAVAPEKAGAASGILSMSRMVGGTFGVAALGALFQHLSLQPAGRHARRHRRDRRPARARSSTTSARAPAATGQRARPRDRRAGRHARSRTPSSTPSRPACGSSAGVAVLGAVMAFVLIAPKSPSGPRRPGARKRPPRS